MLPEALVKQDKNEASYVKVRLTVTIRLVALVTVLSVNNSEVQACNIIMHQPLLLFTEKGENQKKEKESDD